MSRAVDVILITGPADDGNVEELSFWMATADAADLGRDDTEQGTGPPGDGQVGSLLPLNGPVGEDLWGGHKRVIGGVWGAATANLHWSRFLDRVRDAPWEDPDQVQLLLRDDGDSYFRVYMFVDGELQNVAPQPKDDGFDRPW